MTVYKYNYIINIYIYIAFSSHIFLFGTGGPAIWAEWARDWWSIRLDNFELICLHNFLGVDKEVFMCRVAPFILQQYRKGAKPKAKVQIFCSIVLDTLVSFWYVTERELMMHSLLGEVVLWVRREFGWVWQGTRWQWRLGINLMEFTAGFLDMWRCNSCWSYSELLQ